MIRTPMEVVLAVRSDGTPVGATLGNDVKLRDFEGRSSLLLTEAKQNNASCAIGPFVRSTTPTETTTSTQTASCCSPGRCSHRLKTGRLRAQDSRTCWAMSCVSPHLGLGRW